MGADVSSAPTTFFVLDFLVVILNFWYLVNFWVFTLVFIFTWNGLEINRGFGFIAPIWRYKPKPDCQFLFNVGVGERQNWRSPTP